MIDRTLRPDVQQISSIALVEPSVLSLQNAIPLNWIANGANEAFKLDLHFEAGTLNGDKLTAIAANELLLSGTKDKTSSEIHEALDLLGGFVNAEVSQEDAVISLYGLIEHFQPLVKLFISTLQNADFPIQELERYIQSKSQAFLIAQEKVAVLARKQFLAALFPDLPHGKQTQLEDIKGINREEVKQFYSNHYKNQLHFVALVGAVKEADIHFLNEQLAGFSLSKATKKSHSFQHHKKEITIEKEGSVQTAIRVGRLLFNRLHEDYMDFTLLNTLLGGFFGSRLMKEIRENKGYTYGISSGIAQSTEMGYFFISTEVKKEVKEDALNAIKIELEKLQHELVPTTELELVKSYTLGQLLKGSDGPFAMMERYLVLKHYGLDLSYYDKLAARVQSITPERLQELAKKYLNWEDMIRVSVG